MVKIKVSDLLDPEKAKKHEATLLAYFEKGGTWKDLLKLDDNTMGAHYQKAFELYKAGDFENSAAAFTYLTTLDPYQETYWMGLAMSRHSNRQLEEATVAYTMAEAIQPEDPIPHLNLAQCYYHLQQKDKARDHLNQALALCNKPEYHELKNQIQLLLQDLGR